MLSPAEIGSDPDHLLQRLHRSNYHHLLSKNIFCKNKLFEWDWFDCVAHMIDWAEQQLANGCLHLIRGFTEKAFSGYKGFISDCEKNTHWLNFLAWSNHFQTALRVLLGLCCWVRKYSNFLCESEVYWRSHNQDLSALYTFSNNRDFSSFRLYIFCDLCWNFHNQDCPLSRYTYIL